MFFVDFQGATQYFRDLLSRREAGELDETSFAEAVAAIRVTDSSGYTWTLDTGGRWLYWDGSAWVAAQANTDQGAGAGGTVGDADPAGTAGSAGASGAAGSPGPAGAASPGPGGPGHALGRALRWFPMILGLLRGRLPPPSIFLQQMRHVPLRKRPQSWWDMAAILGGSAAGTLWFLYSCVRGLPHFVPLQRSYEGFGDFFPPLLMGIGAFALWTFRRRVFAVLRPVLAPLAKVPLAGRFAGGGVLLVAGWWFRYRSGLFLEREGVDLITPLLMVALPVLIVVFREPLDGLLRPLAPIRSKIPRIVLVLVGLAVPFLVAHIVYHWFGIIQYPFLRISVVLGTMLSYAIIRTPARPAPGAGATAPARGSGPPPLPGGPMGAQRRAAWVGLAWILGAHLLMVSPVFADDFFRDPFNGNDGLRTPGVATAIAGTVTVVVSGLVNGAEVVRTIIEVQGGEEGGGSEAGGGGAAAGGAGGGQTEQELQVDIVVTTTDARGQPGTRLEPGVNDAVFIYARCQQLGSGSATMPCEILGFHLGSGAPFVFLHDHGMVGGQRCAGVQIEDPLPEGMPPSTVSVTVLASIGGKNVSVPVSLVFVAPQYFIRFS